MSQSILFFDIETVCNKRELTEMSDSMQELWALKSSKMGYKTEEGDAEDPAKSFIHKGAIFAEFGKIVCISVGILRNEEGINKFYVRSFADDNEAKLLMEFSAAIDKHFGKTSLREPTRFICGHNVREFDVPYICRRMLINGIKLPSAFNIGGKKPWETTYILDTLELWKFGDYKNFTSLKLLCGVFDIPTPKDDIDGSQVGVTYWQENDLPRISAYCQKDVLATARLFQKMTLQPTINDEDVIFK